MVVINRNCHDLPDFISHTARGSGIPSETPVFVPMDAVLAWLTPMKKVIKTELS